MAEEYHVSKSGIITVILAVLMVSFGLFYIVHKSQPEVIIIDEGDDFIPDVPSETNVGDDSCDADCRYVDAVRRADIDSCQDIGDEDLRINCQIIVADTLVIEESVLTGNIEACAKFEDENREAFCRDNFYLALAINEGDKSYCDNIVSSQTKEYCDTR
jgi:hypothetical protein